MKKYWVLAILTVAVLAFAACGGGNEAAPGTGAANEIADANETQPVEEAELPPEVEEAPEYFPVVIAEWGADVVYALSADYEFQNMPVGTSGSDERVLTTEYLMGAGTPTFRVIENPRGGRAIQLSNRDQEWHAVDIVTPLIGLDTEANSYLLTIHGNISSGGNVAVGGGNSPYATLFTQASPAGDFTLTGTITAATIANSGERGHFRVTVNNLGNLEIHEILIERIDLIVPFEVPERPENVMYSLITDAYVQSRVPGDSGNGSAIFGGTPYLTDAGSPTFTIVPHPSGDASRAFRVSNRNADWHTLDINVANMGLDLDANTYTIRASGLIVNPPEGSTADLMGHGDPWGRFGAVDVEADGYFTVEGVLSAETMAENGSTDRVRLAASAEAGEADFYVFELEVTRN
ncbi:MAG: hypothetical protein FWB96_07745 [Defluviitaleaceae bacterium]|nr:hypothetical protein [Defluviitaleaceae bacterium]MCL2262880.1 hypothetical protein [Defluviitaleaceae bacterium]